MNGERPQPNELGNDEEFVDEAIEDEVDDELEADAGQRVDSREFRDADIDPDEVEADDQLRLDRKELSELGLDLDNPDGFADE